MVIAVAAFEVYRHRKINGRCNPGDDLFDEREWCVLTVAEALRLCNRPAARRDRLGPGALNDLGGPA